MDIKGALGKIATRQDLTGEEMRSVMTIIMNGEATPSQIGAFLMGLPVKGEGTAVCRHTGERYVLASGSVRLV